MEGPLGLEPRTPCLKGRCSNQLSYGPARVLEYQKTLVNIAVYSGIVNLLGQRLCRQTTRYFLGGYQ
jgi:hypothetical protein